MSEWISIDDHRPIDHTVSYLVASNWGVRMAYLHDPDWGRGFQDVATNADEGMFGFDEKESFRVTHWMPLPEMP